MIKSRRSRLLTFITTTIAITLCISIAFLGILAYLLPQRAVQSFGPPAFQVDPLETVFLSFQIVRSEPSLLRPLNPDGGAVEFTISLGEPASEVVRNLYAAQLIENPQSFLAYMRYKAYDTSIQAGTYTLSPAMSAVMIAQEIQDSSSQNVTFNILPGWRIEEIAAALPTSGLSISPEEFIAAAANPAGDFHFMRELPPGASLEGFLFPATYEFERSTQIKTFIHTIAANFDTQVTADIWQGFSRQGLSFYQGVTLASIIEREAVDDGEMPLIASVFHNRLVAGMKLDSDPTVQYALGFNSQQKSWWTNPLSFDDLEIASPYNTYRVAGLPPGPIANPGMAALEAAAFPAQTPYYYFRAMCDQSGRHNFSQTFEEHLQKACP